jgi:DNA repair exonuclease SbcCD ATPase subunit
MKLVRIEIDDFKTYHHADIDLSDGLTIFVGDNSAGKSNILRAIQWVFYNHPSGDGVIRHGAKLATVKLTLDDGVKVIRQKGKVKGGGSVNRYCVEYPDMEPVCFDTVGRDVPELVRKVLGVSYMVPPDESACPDWNILKQADPPFLLSDSPIQRSKLLNVFIGVDAIDGGVKVLRGRAKAKEAEVKTLRETAERLKERLNSFRYLLGVERKFEELEPMVVDIDALSRRLDALRGLSARLGHLRLEAERAAMRQTKTLGILKDLGNLRDTICDYANKMSELEDLKNRVYNVRGALQTATGRISALSSRGNADNLMNVLKTVSGRYEMLTRFSDALKKCEQDICASEQTYSKSSETVADLVEQYSNLLMEIGRCPVCGSPPNTSDIRDHLLEN